MRMEMSQLWEATESMEKTAETSQAVGFFTRDRLRQESVLDRVMPPQFVTQADIERNTNDDYPLIRVEKELDTKAFSLGFHGAAETNWFEGSKYEILFGNIRTQEHNKTQEELMTMRAPVVDYFNRNGVFDLGAQADRIYRAGLDAAAAAVTGGVITDSTSTAFTKATAVKALKVLERRRLAAGCWICTEARWNDLLLMTPNDIGYTLVGEMAIGGAKKIPTFLDIPVVRAIELQHATANPNGVWDDKKIYLISTPDFHGKNFVLTDVTYHMKREYNNLTWAAWMSRGAGIGNAKSVVRVDLTNGNVD